MLRCVLFDLDGTLFETGAGIMRCIREAVQECGIRVGAEDDFHRFVGPPVIDALQEFYGVDREEAERIKCVYREKYAAGGVDECEPVAGARECLERLAASGLILAVATSKPLRFAMRILERFGFLRYFAYVSADEGEIGAPKGEVIARALSALHVSARDCVMVGDRKYDVYGASEHGIRCICYRSPHAAAGEYEQAGAWRVADTYEQIEADIRSLL